MDEKIDRTETKCCSEKKNIQAEMEGRDCEIVWYEMDECGTEQYIRGRLLVGALFSSDVLWFKMVMMMMNN